MPVRKTIPAGEVFSRLVVLRPAAPFIRPNGYQKYRVLCRCVCGKETIVLEEHLRNGNTKSCGCLSVEKSTDRMTTHGQSSTYTYHTWTSMNRRCSDPTVPTFKYYGGRGITVCERWKKFENFLADMGPRPPGLTIERKDNDGNYEPGNCRWATSKQQNRNKRNNHLLTFNGQTLTVAEWTEKTGFKSLKFRILNGWPIEKALTKTPRKSPRRS